ncbi:MAG: SpoVG family protein [Oscillospiraceae bacterium]
MKITDIKIRHIFDEGSIKAIVSITIDKIFVVHDIKIIENNEHRFVAMPSRLDDDGNHRDIVHPISSTARHAIEEVILNAYDSHIAVMNDMNSRNLH